MHPTHDHTADCFPVCPVETGATITEVTPAPGFLAEFAAADALDLAAPWVRRAVLAATSTKSSPGHMGTAEAVRFAARFFLPSTFRTADGRDRDDLAGLADAHDAAAQHHADAATGLRMTAEAALANGDPAAAVRAARDAECEARQAVDAVDALRALHDLTMTASRP